MRWSLCLVAVLAYGCSAGERPTPRSHVRPPQAVIDLGMRETNSIEITVRGEYPRLELIARTGVHRTGSRRSASFDRIGRFA